MLEYYGTVGRSRNYSCRVHSYDDPKQTLTEKLIYSTNEKNMCGVITTETVDTSFGISYVMEYVVSVFVH